MQLDYKPALSPQLRESQEYTGHYPESVHVDKIYWTRDNRAWCKERGIRISGLPLGRPPVNISKETKQQALEDDNHSFPLILLFQQALISCSVPMPRTNF